MLKLLAMPFYFFRELIFESREEYDIKSTSFNTKKVLTFFLLVLSICLNMAMLWRIVDLALENIELKETIIELSSPTTEVEVAPGVGLEVTPPTRSTE